MEEAAHHPLKTWRLEQGLTQEQMANAVGCTKQALGRYEKGRRPHQPILDAIVLLTDGAVTANDWLGEVANACVQPDEN